MHSLLWKRWLCFRKMRILRSIFSSPSAVTIATPCNSITNSSTQSSDFVSRQQRRLTTHRPCSTAHKCLHINWKFNLKRNSFVFYSIETMCWNCCCRIVRQTMPHNANPFDTSLPHIGSTNESRCSVRLIIKSIRQYKSLTLDEDTLKRIWRWCKRHAGIPCDAKRSKSGARSSH